MSSIKRTSTHDNVPATHKSTAKAAHGDSAHSKRQNLIASVHGRETSQQARIDQGVKSGELTKGEAKKLENQQKQIEHKLEHAKHGGLTKQEAKEIRKEQNKASQAIYSQKHDDQVTNGAQKMGVTSRWERQSDRIQNGIDSGQITGKEADKLTKIEAKIEAKESLAGISGGKISEKERLQIEHLQDRASKMISNLKQNKAAEPSATSPTTTAPTATATAPVTTTPVDYTSFLNSVGLGTGDVDPGNSQA